MILVKFPMIDEQNKKRVKHIRQKAAKILYCNPCVSRFGQLLYTFMEVSAGYSTQR